MIENSPYSLIMLPPRITILLSPRFLIIALAILRVVQILGVEICRIALISRVQMQLVFSRDSK